MKEIDAKELNEWMAYYRLEPFGTEQDYLQAGIIASVLGNINKKPSARAFEPEDFVPSCFKTKIAKKQSAETIRDIFRSFAKIVKKKDKKNG